MASDLEDAEFGAFFRKIREARNLDLRQLSEIARISQENLQRLEEGADAARRPLSDLHHVLASLNASDTEFYELSTQLGKLTTKKLEKKNP